MIDWDGDPGEPWTAVEASRRIAEELDRLNENLERIFGVTEIHIEQAADTGKETLGKGEVE